ncbi:MAG: serine--tRNA ligase [Parcubacteria group bacterium]
MIDIKIVRDNPDLVKETAKNKGVEVDIDKLLKLDEDRRSLRSEIDELNRKRNELSKSPAGGKPDEISIEKGKELKKEISKKEEGINEVESEYKDILWQVPNIPYEDVPVGQDDLANKILRKVGDKTEFDFGPREHWELGEELDIIDNETASAVAGTRFAYLKGDAALLEFALIQYALSVLTDEKKLSKIIKDAKLDVSSKPFIPVIPPIFIKEDVYNKMGRLEPRDDRYHMEGTDQWLIGSAEHTMGPMHMDEVFNKKDLPIRYAGFSTALRQEAGTYGKDTKGIFRLHQFEKVEMESFSTPEQGIAEHELMIAIQEYLMQSLEIPYQVVLKCTIDMGTPNARGVDIESWMPGQNKYRETHTADYMTDYQARRLGTKYRQGGKSEFVHMNDATAFAGRTIVAIMENYQTKEGTIKIPKVLHPYMFGVKEIKKK